MADTDVSVGSGPTPASTPMSVGSQLCTQCGLCCTGALHDTATVREEEVERVRELGFDVITEENLRFRLPCRHLKGTSCGIYSERPSSCASYRCKLLREVEAGTIESVEALSKVHEAWRLFNIVLEQMPAGMTFPEARALSQGKQPLPEFPSASSDPRLRLQTLALMRYVDQNFRHAKEGPLLHEEILAIDGRATLSVENEDRKDV